MTGVKGVTTSRRTRARLASDGALLLVAVAFALPYSPLAPSLGFAPLPPVLVALIVAIVAGYVVAAESLKRAFYRQEGQAPPGPPAAPQFLPVPSPRSA